jgi:hypothetical protein
MSPFMQLLNYKNNFQKFTRGQSVKMPAIITLHRNLHLGPKCYEIYTL